ncbi:conserved hypothetical membrane protein [Chloroherpeton thalassium ATCC 35110]|uniref:Conserved hypothetical membrane protein n=1 Tax=Chloroherpeton thalassium (strain ATCC 35110 / GB-78) TaxID=517418 RepID=B3QXG9_CHLT3|nr:BatA domain-containing protein [Chloroherpeton thalassium]ACF13443.1 conserved hypothetical membrane protein [Chloroherpeton thalassium ATCC 35110]
MTFLNPAILFALFAAAVPILIHFLNMKRRKKIEFASLQLIKEIQKSSLRRFKIRQWLLLLLRSLAIFLLVLAFSKPILPGYLAGNGFSNQTKTSAAIVFDTSPSMRYADQRNGDQWRVAKTAAMEVLENFSENDEIFLLFSCEASASVAAMSVAEARRQIAQQETSPVFSPTEELLRRALWLLANAKNFNRECYLISDFHPSGFLAQDTAFAKRRDYEKINLFVLNVAPSDKQNVALYHHEVLTKIFEPQKPIRVQAQARFSQSEPAQNAVVQLFLKEKLSAEKSLSPQPDGTAQTVLTAMPSGTGCTCGKILLEDDNLNADNQRFFSVYIPEKIHVLMAYENRETVRFLEAALKSYENPNFFELDFVSARQLDARNFAPFDALLLVGLENFSKTTLQKLKVFMENGGGVMLFAAPELKNYESYNQLLKLLGGGRFQPASETLDKSSFTLDPPHVRHPIFDGIYQNSNLARSNSQLQSSELPQIFARANYDKSPSEAAVLTYLDGRALCSSLKHGNGAAVIFATLPTPQATNLVWQPIFAPLIFRSVFFVSKKAQSATMAYTVGKPDEAILPQGTALHEHLIVKKPSGKAFIAPLRERLGSVRLQLQPALFDEIGIYEVRKSGAQGEELLEKLALNLAPSESEMGALKRQQVQQAIMKTGVDSTHIYFAETGKLSNEAVASLISGSRYGFGIWKYLLALAAACLILETVLAKKVRA